MIVQWAGVPRVMMRRWWHGWPTWAAYAALAWSLVYGGLAVIWSLSGAAFPFGNGDPEGASMGSVMFATKATAVGPVFVICCLLGAAVAWAMLRPADHRIPHRAVLAAAWLFAAILILVLPDVRLLQSAAYALMFVFVKTSWPVMNQVVLVMGGVAFAAAALGYRRRVDGTCQNCGRAARDDSAPRVLRWGTAATWIAVLAPVPYGLTRLLWAFGIPFGIDQDPSTQSLLARIGEGTLAMLAIGGGVVTLGLIRPWGEIWPRWIPVLAGRRIPVALPTVLGALASLVVTVGAFALLRIVATDELGLTPPPEEPPSVTGWATGAPGFLWPFWGIGLGVATVAYYYRRRGTCRMCHQG